MAYARCKIQRVADPEAYPVIPRYHWHEKQLCDIHGEKEREERVAMYIKHVRPFDFRVGRRGVGRWLEKDSIGEEPQTGSDDDTGKKKVAEDHKECQFDGLKCCVRVDYGPRNGGD